MIKLLKFLGFMYCFMCRKYRFFGREIEGADNKLHFLCERCRNSLREE
jgi:hypothetical protein